MRSCFLIISFYSSYSLNLVSRGLFWLSRWITGSSRPSRHSTRWKRRIVRLFSPSRSDHMYFLLDLENSIMMTIDYRFFTLHRYPMSSTWYLMRNRRSQSIIGLFYEMVFFFIIKQSLMGMNSDIKVSSEKQVESTGADHQGSFPVLQWWQCRVFAESQLFRHDWERVLEEYRYKEQSEWAVHEWESKGPSTLLFLSFVFHDSMSLIL